MSSEEVENKPDIDQKKRERLQVQAQMNIQTLLVRAFASDLAEDYFFKYQKAREVGETSISAQSCTESSKPKQPTPISQPLVECEICFDKVIASRYTAHRTKCLGLGRRSNREAQKKISQMCNSTDNEDANPPKKKKSNKKKKVKK